MEQNLVSRISPFRTTDSRSQFFGITLKIDDLNWAGLWAYYGRSAKDESWIELSAAADKMTADYSSAKTKGSATINFSRVRNVCENFDCGAHISDVVKEIAVSKRFRIFSKKEGILVSQALRGIYYNQPQAKITGDEILIVLMEPAADEKYVPKVFSLECDRGILQLCSQYFHSFIDKNTWVAFCPKTQKYLL